MLSVNYISNFLDKNQKKIDEKSYLLKEFEFKKEYENLIIEKKNEYNNLKKNSYNDLYECFNYHFEKSLFGFNKQTNTNKNVIFTFFSSIFGIGNESYYLFNDEEKIKCIKNLIHKMDNDILAKNYYNEFKYDKNKYFNKQKILTSLKECFNLKLDENFSLIKKYTADFLGINIFIYELKNKEIINSYKIESNKFTDMYNEHLPNYFIVKENNEYIPIMIKDKENINYIIKGDEYKIISELSRFKDFKYDDNNNIKNNNIKKMKIDELREYCINNNINIYKTSEKTGKQIKKTKDELLSEIN